jgi:hypothetical protein
MRSVSLLRCSIVKQHFNQLRALLHRSTIIYAATVHRFTSAHITGYAAHAILVLLCTTFHSQRMCQWTKWHRRIFENSQEVDPAW